MSDSNDHRRYLEWKSWNQSDFGLRQPLSTRYFDGELASKGVALRGGLRILEIGFGNGEFLRYARDHGCDVVGTELNPELVNTAKSAGYSAFTPENFETAPDSDFHLIVLFDVLEHIPQDELPAMLASLAARLAIGGKIFCRFPNGDSPLGRPFQYGDVTHITVIGEFKLNYIARAAGLKVIRFGGQFRVLPDRRFRTLLSYAMIRLMELVVERPIKSIFYRGWRFAVFSPNSIAVIARPAK
jgi:2-polyprenyl-3-methyl-5-hydroxy-6-metoxy-1,4-benzoquinol methylase